MTDDYETVPYPNDAAPHEHMWNDSEPELFTRGLVRCRICEIRIPRNLTNLDATPADQPTHDQEGYPTT